MAEHADIAYGIVHDAIAELTFAECKDVLGRGTGQWAPVQDAWEMAHDEALTANGRIANVIDAEGTPKNIGGQSGEFRR